MTVHNPFPRQAAEQALPIGRAHWTFEDHVAHWSDWYRNEAARCAAKAVAMGHKPRTAPSDFTCRQHGITMAKLECPPAKRGVA